MDDLVKLITQLVGDWKGFARCMNFLESEIRLIETQAKLQLSTEYASHFMKIFLDRKQDVTSWAFWYNLLNKFDDGKLCIETINRLKKITLREDDLSKCHFNLISQKILDWRRFSRVLGYNEEQIQQAQKDFKTTKERNKYFMKLKLNNENSTWEFWKEYLEMFDEGQICIQEIKNENTIFISDGSTTNSNIDLINIISIHIKDWKEFAKLMNFNNFQIRQVENSILNNKERCFHLIKKFINGEQDITTWMFWRNLLSKYEEGKLIINEVEKSKIRLFRQGSQAADHKFVKHNSGVISHQYDWFRSSLQLELDHNKEISVNIGAQHDDMQSFEKYKSWLKTKQDYYERFSLFQQLNTFDFTDSLSQCKILQNLHEILNEMNNKSFAVKGYSVKNHYSLFGKTAVMKEDSSQTLFIYLENENIFLNINICEKDENISESIHKSLESYQYFQAIHEDIQASNSIFIGVVAFDDAIKNFKEFCPTCFEKHLLISKNVLTDKNTLRNWINDITNSETVADIRSQLRKKSNDIENAIVGSTVKRDILTFKALQRDEYPSFAMSGESQTRELKKLLFLTPVQIAILLTKNKHIVITGGYGSGKSLALMKKFKQVLSQLTGSLLVGKDVFYLICHDRQSKFLNQMELYKKEYPDITFVCIYPKVTLQKMKLSEIISEYTSQTDSNTNVHFFIDEFDGSCFDENEVRKLTSMIDQLKNSFIVIATQSLENRLESKDTGFRYEKLEKKANFSWFQLDSSMRCSLQINNFIKETTSFLESLKTRRAVKNTYNSATSSVDIEYALENAPLKHFGEEEDEFSYKFNQPAMIGHNVSCEKVCLYTFDASEMHQFYSIYLMLDEILSFDEDDRFVICLYDETLYNSIGGMMQYLDEEWTGDIQEFLHMSKKRILITDYASVRGYEFENFMFILKMNQKFMKFRYVECFSRATTSLYVIADTAGLTEDCDETKLLAVWENSENVSHFKMDYKTESDEYILSSQSENEVIVLEKKNLKLREENVFASTASDTVDKYPWRNIHFDDIVDQVPALKESMKTDNVDNFLGNLKTYQMDMLTLLEDDEGLIYTKEIFKGMDPVNIVKHFLNTDAFTVDINAEVTFFGSVVNMPICNGSIETTEYLLKMGSHIDVQESDRETNIQLPLSSEMVSLFGKYGLTKCSVFGKRWLGIAFFFDDIALFEHTIHANSLNAKTHKVCDWYPLLRLALYHKAMKIGELLITKYKVDINEQDIKYQKTVLHQAAITNKIQFAELVLAHGADILIKDRYGNTPYQYAISQEMKNLIVRYQPKMDLAEEPDLD